MKKSKFFLMLVAMLLFASVTSTVYAFNVKLENEFIEKEAVVYEYPVIPGTEEWAELNSLQEMYNILQLPEDVLENASTDELLDVVLRYPLFDQFIFAYSDYETGMLEMYNNFNGFRELVDRLDLGNVLINEYKSNLPRLLEVSTELNALNPEYETINDVIFFKNNDDFEIVKEMNNSAFYEAIITFSKVIDKLEPKEIKLGSEIIASNIIMRQNTGKSSIFSEYKILDAIENSNEMSQYIKFELDTNENKMELQMIQPDDNSLLESNMIENFKINDSNNISIDNDMVLMSAMPPMNSVYIFTPNGSRVVGFTATSDYTYSEMASVNQVARNLYPNASFSSNSTWKYNCHSFSFYSRSTSNTVWLNSPETYLSDKSYIKTGTINKFNTVIIYNRYNVSLHSGVVTSMPSYGPYTASQLRVTSKWGDGPLMEHSANYCPYSSNYFDLYWR